MNELVKKQLHERFSLVLNQYGAGKVAKVADLEERLGKEVELIIQEKIVNDLLAEVDDVQHGEGFRNARREVELLKTLPYKPIDKNEHREVYGHNDFVSYKYYPDLFTPEKNEVGHDENYRYLLND